MRKRNCSRKAAPWREARNINRTAGTSYSERNVQIRDINININYTGPDTTAPQEMGATVFAQIQRAVTLVEEESNAEWNTPPCLSPTMAFRQSIQALMEQGLIVSKQDFSILYCLDKEMCLLGACNCQDFAEKVVQFCPVPKSLQPTAGSIKTFCFGNHPYPEWDFTGIEAKKTHIRAIANGYIREMAKRGFAHPQMGKIMAK